MNESATGAQIQDGGKSRNWRLLFNVLFFVGPWLCLGLLCRISPNAAGNVAWLFRRPPMESVRPHMESSLLVPHVAEAFRASAGGPTEPSIDSETPALEKADKVDHVVAALLPENGRRDQWKGHREEWVRQLAGSSPCLALRLAASFSHEDPAPDDGTWPDRADLMSLARRAMAAEPENAYPVLWAMVAEQGELFPPYNEALLPGPGGWPAAIASLPGNMSQAELKQRLKRCRQWFQLAAAKPRYDDHFEEVARYLGRYYSRRPALTVETLARAVEVMRSDGGPPDIGTAVRLLIAAAEKLEGPRELREFRTAVAKVAVLQIVGHHPYHNETNGYYLLHQASGHITSYAVPNNIGITPLFDGGQTLGLMKKWAELTGDEMLKRNFQFLLDHGRASANAGNSGSKVQQGAPNFQALWDMYWWPRMILYGAPALLLFWLISTPALWGVPRGPATSRPAKVDISAMRTGGLLWWFVEFGALMVHKIFNVTWVSVIPVATGTAFLLGAVGFLSHWLDFVATMRRNELVAARSEAGEGENAVAKAITTFSEPLLLLTILTGWLLLMALGQRKLTPLLAAARGVPLAQWLIEPVFFTASWWSPVRGSSFLHWHALLCGSVLLAGYVVFAAWLRRLLFGYWPYSGDEMERYALLQSWRMWLASMLALGAWAFVLNLTLMIPAERALHRELALMATPMDVTGRAPAEGKTK